MKELVGKDFYDEDFSKKFLKFTTFLSKYYSLKSYGVEKLDRGPCLYVANHSIGAPQDVFLLFHLWQTRFKNIKFRGLTHQIQWQPPFSLMPVIPRLGGIYASQENAADFLSKGYSLVTFPGGDIEAFRAFSERYKVNLANRMGFIRLAKKLNVPIRPIVICGTHSTYINLFQIPLLNKALERLFRFKAFSINISQLLLALTFLPPFWKFMPLALFKQALPLPSKVEISFGDEVDVSNMPEQESYQKVEQTMQNMMDELKSHRSCPWF